MYLPLQKIIEMRNECTTDPDILHSLLWHKHRKSCIWNESVIMQI